MADEKLNTGPGSEKLPEAPGPVAADQPQAPAVKNSRRLPNRPPHPRPSRNRPGLPSPLPAMWWCPLTRSMS